MLEQRTIVAREVTSEHHIMFGTELYRVYMADPTPKMHTRTDTALMEIWLITDLRRGVSPEVVLKIELYCETPITVFFHKK